MLMPRHGCELRCFASLSAYKHVRACVRVSVRVSIMGYPCGAYVTERERERKRIVGLASTPKWWQTELADSGASRHGPQRESAGVRMEGYPDTTTEMTKQERSWAKSGLLPVP